MSRNLHTVARTASRALVLWLTSVWILHGASAQAPERFDLVVQDAPLVEALAEINRLTNAGLIYDPALVRGRRADCTAQGATTGELLDCVLHDVGLTHRRLPSGAYTIERSSEEGETSKPAEPARLSGVVTDASNGQPLQGATIALRVPGERAVAYGTATDKDGFYVVGRIHPGRYVPSVSFVGFHASVDTLTLRSDERRSRAVALMPRSESLGEVHVGTERDVGMSQVSAGHQRIRPRDTQLIPAADAAPDLAASLNLLPSVVSTGLRGGQGYVRGGEPAQNLVLLDGMVVYQPFHALRGYSVFPADVVRRVDLHAGGFPARYSGRLSSVMDVAARSGNDRSFGGMAAASPFLAAVRVEGPILPERASFLVSARTSMLERVSLGDADLPVRFGDVFAKLYGTVTRNSRLSVSALRTHDRSTLQDASEGPIRWTNEALGVRWTFVPSLMPIIMSVNVSRSRHHTEFGPRRSPIRLSTISHTRIATHAAFEDGRTAWEGGWEVILADADNVHDGLFQLPQVTGTPFTEFGFYAEPTYELGHGLRLMPSARLQWYQMRVDPLLEPRLRVVWDRDVHRLSAALGLYHQEVVGIADRRDAANTFTLWSVPPRAHNEETERLAGRLGRAVHAVASYRVAPRSWLEASVEGYYRRLSNLVVAEWTPLASAFMPLHPAVGRSAGVDTRLEMRRRSVFAALGYALSFTRYRASYDAAKQWLGSETLTFRPPHDRRHTLSAVVHAGFEWFDVSASWSYGSGLPYTRVLGYGSVADLGDMENLFETERTRRLLYDRPFGATLPGYHRLDVAVERSFAVSAAELTLRGSLLNVYDRENVFYFDPATQEAVDQLPFVPSIGLRARFE